MKLIKGVNAVQVYCGRCGYYQLIPKQGPKVCGECGNTRTETERAE